MAPLWNKKGRAIIYQGKKKLAWTPLTLKHTIIYNGWENEKSVCKEEMFTWILAV